MPEEWDQINELFNAALEREPGERRDFLRQACGQDDLLRTEIESLLSSYETSFLEDSPAGDVFQSAGDAMGGKRIGAYRIIGECGRGGMSVVYLAERADEQYRKRVAIKMIQPGANNEQILARFRNERQTLAALDHPNIVKLLDGGSTEEGMPYLVMEYVEGLPIDNYCHVHALSIHQRLTMFQTVCSVVQYAHQNLVIHRDLKPSNILITADGVPRLLDFGIAKLLNPDCLQTPMVTRTDWRPMTPEYASPEQVRGDPITIATDVYSLGVLLYELLTGQRPYPARHVSGLELERLVCEQDPEKPSAAVGKIAQDASKDRSTAEANARERLAQAPSTRPEELRRQLQGDLDTIVMMALRKEPERRYASVEELSCDIERHLSGRPVQAHQPTLLYRGGKFLRRHGESVAAVVIALALMTGVGVWEARRIWKQNVVAQQGSSVRFRARPSVAILGFKNLSGRPETAWLSTALSEILTSELAAGEQLRVLPGETVARTKIDLSLSDVESIPPQTLAQVRTNLGTDFFILGSYLDLGKENGGRIRLDLRVQDAMKGETTATVSESGTEPTILGLALQVGARLRDQFALRKLSEVESGAVRAELPSGPEAMRLYSQGLARQRSFDALGARELLGRAVAADPSFPLAHSVLATACSSLGYDASAVQEAKKALDRAANLSREKHLVVEGAYAEVSKNWKVAIEAYETLFSFFPDSVEYGLNLARAQALGGKGKDALNTLASLTKSGAAAKDDPRIDLARAEAGSSLGDDQLRRDAAHNAANQAATQGARLLLARARTFECRALANLGENDQAKPVCKEARQIYLEVGDRSGLARSLHALAEIPINQGDLVAAQKLYEQALSLARATGDQHAIGRELINLGVIHKQQGNFVRARQMYDAALDSYRKTGDLNGMALCLGNTANLLCAQGKLSEALPRYKKALALSEEVGNNSAAAVARENTASLLAAGGDLPGALVVAQQALDKLREGGQKHYYAGTLVVAGQILQQQGELHKALDAYVEARSLQELVGEKGPVADTDLALAELNCDMGKPAEAETRIRGALPEFLAEKDTDQESRAQTLLSRSFLQLGKLVKAQEAIANALKVPTQGRDITVRLPLEIQLAYVRAAAKDFRRAEQTAHNVLAEASRLGLVRYQFEASLALGEIQLKGQNPGAGRTRLKQLEKKARAKGFELIAQKAAAARA